MFKLQIKRIYYLLLFIIYIIIALGIPNLKKNIITPDITQSRIKDEHCLTRMPDKHREGQTAKQQIVGRIWLAHCDAVPVSPP